MSTPLFGSAIVLPGRPDGSGGSADEFGLVPMHEKSAVFSDAAALARARAAIQTDKHYLRARAPTAWPGVHGREWPAAWERARRPNKSWRPVAL